MKHFETATIGASAARELLFRGEIVAVETRRFNVAALAREIMQRDKLCAVYADGSRQEIPAYAGDTPERIRQVAALSWGEKDEALYKQRVANGEFGEYAPDKTGACL